MPFWFVSSWFDYPVKRSVSLPPGPLRYFNIAVLTLGVIYAVVITLINVVAVGYESITVDSTNFNSSAPLWYEQHFLPKTQLLPPSRNCSPSFIKINEGSTSLRLELI